MVEGSSDLGLVFSFSGPEGVRLPWCSRLMHQRKSPVSKASDRPPYVFQGPVFFVRIFCKDLTPPCFSPNLPQLASLS